MSKKVLELTMEIRNLRQQLSKYKEVVEAATALTQIEGLFVGASVEPIMKKLTDSLNNLKH